MSIRYTMCMVKMDKKFLVRFDERILNRLREVAEEEGRTVTDLIREAVAELLSDRERGRKSKTGGKS